MLLTISLVSLIVVSLCWIVGDALIVGFHKPDKDEHADFIGLMGDDTFAFYTRVNNARLQAGALVADYSAPLWLVGLYSQWVLLDSSALALPAVVLLGVGYALSPLAHAAFYPLALASERAHELMAAGQDTTAAVLHARRLRSFLLRAWVPAIVLTALGWLVVAVAIVIGSTPLPWWAALLTPVVQAPVWAQLPRVPYPGKPLLDGALFNIVSLVWAVALLVLSAFYPLT